MAYIFTFTPGYVRILIYFYTEVVMDKKHFGTLPCGEDVYLYRIENGNITLAVTDFGAAVVSLKVYSRDVVGGFDRLEDYLADDSHQGGTIGRIANRVAGAKFSMDGRIYTLPNNDGGNCLHGGEGFDRRLWQLKEHNENSITFTYVSKDGEEGFPSEVQVSATYTIKDYDLCIEYRAIPDGRTPISMTNHTYFNLDGFGGTVLDHKIAIFADRYTEVDNSLIPTGKTPLVENTVFDLRGPIRIGTHFGSGFSGYDHNYIFDRKEGENLTRVAVISTKDMGMTVYTNQPCIQFYTGNFLGNGPDFKGGIKQVRHGAFCLETQTEPNSVNKGEGFYSSGEEYTHKVVYSFKRG